MAKQANIPVAIKMAWRITGTGVKNFIELDHNTLVEFVGATPVPG